MYTDHECDCVIIAVLGGRLPPLIIKTGQSNISWLPSVYIYIVGACGKTPKLSTQALPVTARHKILSPAALPCPGLCLALPGRECRP